jgi:hypothetical protein
MTPIYSLDLTRAQLDLLSELVIVAGMCIDDADEWINYQAIDDALRALRIGLPTKWRVT